MKLKRLIRALPILFLAIFLVAGEAFATDTSSDSGRSVDARGENNPLTNIPIGRTKPWPRP
ncbi:MAG: hypothetical protein QGH51_02450 [Planctomycetota bacterium]|jgi:hypothetical protein|nr:hypothetical protein [Planctomycetota bacterium]MDP6940864.1 hypothetical protein [Planctomycetota bacterium]